MRHGYQPESSTTPRGNPPKTGSGVMRPANHLAWCLCYSCLADSGARAKNRQRALDAAVRRFPKMLDSCRRFFNRNGLLPFLHNHECDAIRAEFKRIMEIEMRVA